MRVPETRVPELPDEVVAVLGEARQRGEAVLGEARHLGEAVLDDVLDRGEAALDVARVRGGAAWDALRGERVGPPVAVRRWPVAVVAALAGAAAAAGVVMLLQRVRTQDAPDAIDPEQVEAVVDRAAPA